MKLKEIDPFIIKFMLCIWQKILVSVHGFNGIIVTMNGWKKMNIEHRTPNIECRMGKKEQKTPTPNKSGRHVFR